MQQDAFTDLPEAVERQDDKEVAPVHEKEIVTSHGKEVAGSDAKELRRSGAVGADGPEAVGGLPSSEDEENGVGKISKRSPKKSRRRAILGCTATIVIIALSVGLSVGLGVGLQVNSKPR
jgi:hypothetical protein